MNSVNAMDSEEDIADYVESVYVLYSFLSKAL